MTTIGVPIENEDRNESGITAYGSVRFEKTDMHSFFIRVTGVAGTETAWPKTSVGTNLLCQNLDLRQPEALYAETDPVLAELWDNDEDDIFDTL